MTREIYTVSLPPEDYPSQKDYGELILQLKEQTTGLHHAFLNNQIEAAQRISASLFDLAAELMKLSSILLIERTNRGKEQGSIPQRRKPGTIEEQIRSTTTRVQAEAERFNGATESRITPKEY